MKSITITELITAVVALYGAVLSTVIFCNNRKKQARKVSIRISTGFLTGNTELSEQMLLIEVSNPSQKEITLDPPFIVLPDRRNMIFPDIGSEVSFPASLSSGKSIHSWIPLNAVKQRLVESGFTVRVKLKTSIRDQTGKTFRSRAFHIDL